jgi:hypothetical protein
LLSSEPGTAFSCSNRSAPLRTAATGTVPVPPAGRPAVGVIAMRGWRPAIQTAIGTRHAGARNGHSGVRRRPAIVQRQCMANRQSGMGKRGMVRGGNAAALAGITGGRPPRAAHGEEGNGRTGGKRAQLPVQFVHCGELSVLFGDGTPHGMGLPGYCGIWSLTSARDPHNAFVASYAGFIYNSHRGLPVEIYRSDHRHPPGSGGSPVLAARLRFLISIRRSTTTSTSSLRISGSGCAVPSTGSKRPTARLPCETPRRTCAT